MASRNFAHMRYKEIQPRADLRPYIGWCVSRKYDGWFVRWTGTKLVTKSGKRQFDLPPQWKKALSASKGVLIGELVVLGHEAPVVASLLAASPLWSRARLHLFDAPGGNSRNSQSFSKRQCALADEVKRVCGRWGRSACPIKRVTQTKATSVAKIRSMFENVKRRGVEGLVITEPDSKYEVGKRSSQRVKLKVRSDEEARVVGYNAKGDRLSGLRLRRGRTTFKLGTGFTEKLRRNYRSRFPIGSYVKYSYRGKTSSGKPKEATFMHRRLAPR